MKQPNYSVTSGIVNRTVKALPQRTRRTCTEKSKKS